jgi:hypothetical protein
MALEATINILQEQNSFLKTIAEGFEKAETKDLERAEKEKEANQVLLSLRDAISGIGGGGAAAAGPAVSTTPEPAIGDKDKKESEGILARLRTSMMALPIVGTLFTSMGVFFSNFRKALGPARAFLGKGLKIVGKVATRFLLPIQGILGGLEGFFQGFEEGGILEGLKQGGIGIIDGMFGWIVETGAKAVGKLVEMVGGPEWLSTALADFDFGKELTNLVNAGTEFFTDIFTNILVWWENFDLGETFKKLTDGLMDMIENFEMPSLDAIGDWIGNTFTAVKNWITEKMGSLLKMAEKLPLGIGDKIKNIRAGMENMAGKMVGDQEPDPTIGGAAPADAASMDAQRAFARQAKIEQMRAEQERAQARTNTRMAAQAGGNSRGGDSNTYVNVQGQTSDKASKSSFFSWLRGDD